MLPGPLTCANDGHNVIITQFSVRELKFRTTKTIKVNRKASPYEIYNTLKTTYEQNVDKFRIEYVKCIKHAHKIQSNPSLVNEWSTIPYVDIFFEVIEKALELIMPEAGRTTYLLV